MNAQQLDAQVRAANAWVAAMDALEAADKALTRYRALTKVGSVLAADAARVLASQAREMIEPHYRRQEIAPILVVVDDTLTDDTIAFVPAGTPLPEDEPAAPEWHQTGPEEAHLRTQCEPSKCGAQ